MSVSHVTDSNLYSERSRSSSSSVWKYEIKRVKVFKRKIVSNTFDSRQRIESSSFEGN